MMGLSPSQVILYAAGTVDYQIALTSAAISGVPIGNVIGDFYTAWQRVSSGNYLVLAVGGAALNALYYNPCGWSNPTGEAGGHTPFALTTTPIDTLPAAKYFEASAGNTASDTLYITTAFVYYAVHGIYPGGFSNHPPVIAPSTVCVGSANVPCPCDSTITTGCLNGLDASTNLSSEASCMWTNTPYSFVGRYLGGPCYPGDVLTQAEAQTLSKKGFYIVSIYSGANDSPNAQCGTQTYQQGQIDAQNAVNLAKMVGQPANTAMYLDLEANQLNSNYRAYLQGWTSELTAFGYLPGVYSSSAQLDTIHSQSWAGTKLLCWVGNWKYSNVQTPAPCPSSELSYAQIWQYAGNATVCNTSVDIDSARNIYGMWKI